MSKKCSDCIYFITDSELCKYKKEQTNADGICDAWANRNDDTPKYGNSYMTSPWDEWKKKAERKKKKGGIMGELKLSVREWNQMKHFSYVNGMPFLMNHFENANRNDTDNFENANRNDHIGDAVPNNKVHLCDFCKYGYPACPAEWSDVIFGNDIGRDNVCACAKFEIKPERTAKARYSEPDGCYLCGECGYVIEIEDVYCAGCGAKLDWRDDE